MRRLKVILNILIVSAAVLCAPGASRAEEKVPGVILKGDSPVEITADYLSYDKETDTYLARGNVVIVQDRVTLNAETALLDSASGTATASGNVVIIDEGGRVVKGQSLTMDIRNKTAVLAKGRIFFKEETVTIAGDVIKKTGPETYEFENTSYTSCECPEGTTPPWDFSVKKATLISGDSLKGKSGAFRIKGVPVLYSPYVSVPVKRGRQTGLLSPRLRYSELRGFGLDNAFYWAISKNTDATFYLDVEAKRGVGEGAEYRYIRTRRSSGEIYLYHFKERDIERVRSFRSGVNNLDRPLSATDDRWQMKLQHTEVLFSGITLRADINIVSDDEYFIDFGRGEWRTIEAVENNVSITKNWDGASLVAQWRAYDNLLRKNDSVIVRKLPEATFTAADRKIWGSPFYISMGSSLINFSRETGITGQRLDLRPRVSLPLSPGGYFDFTPSVGPRATFYLADGGPENRYSDRYLYDLKADLAATFVRVFGGAEADGRAFKHTLRPRLVYTYLPAPLQQDLPQFDAEDNVVKANTFTYSLNSTVTGRFMEEGRKRYFDYLYFDISQSYDINEASRRLSAPLDKRRPFSDISAEMLSRPAEWAKITAKGVYDVYEHWFTSYDTSLSLEDKRGDFFRASHRFVRGANRYIEGSAKAHVTGSVALTYLNRYSFDEQRSLETSYGIDYAQQCWGAVLSYTERLEERLIYLTFSLKGIGRVAGIQEQLVNR